MTTAGIEIINQIGETAGRVFKALEAAKRDQSIADLKRAARLENGELIQQAIGWLARENKLNITTNLKGELRISLR